MYEINYIGQHFFIITKPQDKNSLNWPVHNGHSSLGLQIHFLSFLKKLKPSTMGMEGGFGGGGGGYANKMGYIYIHIFLEQNCM